MSCPPDCPCYALAPPLAETSTRELGELFERLCREASEKFDRGEDTTDVDAACDEVQAELEVRHG